MTRGLFLVIEGIEGAGKTTQAALLNEWLRARGVPQRSTREPGGTVVGEAIRGILLGGDELPMPVETELLLILGARAAFVREIVEPALDGGEVVVADRFSYSTLAYQGYGRGLDLERVASLNAFATGGLVPDLCLVLDVPVDVGRARQRAEGKPGDRFERSGAAFLGRVARGYRDLAARDARAVLLDGRLPERQVHERVVAELVRRFPETFRSGAV